MQKLRLMLAAAAAATLVLGLQVVPAAANEGKPGPFREGALTKLKARIGPDDGISKATADSVPGGFSLAAGSADSSPSAVVPPDSGCNVGFDKNITQFPQQSDGGVSVAIVYSSSIACSPDVQFDGVSILVNRTFPYDGTPITAGNEIFGSISGTSVGFAGIGSAYPGANNVETVFVVQVFSPFGWAGCFNSPGVRVLSCEGVGTTVLSAILGSGVYSSGKKDPTNTTPPPPGAFLRLWNPANGDHFHTNDVNEYQAAQQCCGYLPEGVKAIVSSAPGFGLVPFYRLWNQANGDHFHTTSWDEVQSAQTLGFVYEGIRAYVYPAGSALGVPFYRLWNPTNGDHFHTTSWDEVQSAQTLGFVYEGIRARVLPS